MGIDLISSNLLSSIEITRASKETVVDQTNKCPNTHPMGRKVVPSLEKESAKVKRLEKEIEELKKKN